MSELDAMMNQSMALPRLNQPVRDLAFPVGAVAMPQTYALPASVQSSRIRLLTLVTLDSVQSQVPLDGFLEDSDVELMFHFVRAGDNMLAAVPEHDVMFVGIPDSDANRGLLQALGVQLKNWPKPVLNAAQNLLVAGQCAASSMVQDAAFSILVRPLGSPGGLGLRKVDSAEDLGAYLADVPHVEFFLAHSMNAQIKKEQTVFCGLLRRLMQSPRAQPVVTGAAARRHFTPNHLNFSGGPGALPESVLAEIQQAIMEVPGTRLSLLGISHRSDWFASVVAELETNVRTLLGLGSSYHVVMLQGGATQQFSMVPMTLLRGQSRPAEYVQTGYWSAKPVVEARREGPVRVVWTGSECGYSRLPSDEELAFSADASYLHYVSNETVEGLQFHRVLGHDTVPRVCDMSSDFLSRPCEAERFSIIYAHAQKNIGPAGVTMVVMRDDVLQHANTDLPDFLNYRTQIQSHSNFNTPPVFSIYVTLLVTRWILQKVGGLEQMDAINRQKAAKMYQFLDASDGFYRGRAAHGDRSLMNVVFSLPTPELESRFLAESGLAGFSGLGGHRAIGGVRASIYNAMSIPAVEQLLGFMADFQRKNQP